MPAQVHEMKRRFPAMPLILGWAAAAWAAAPAPLTTLHAIHALSNAEAEKQIPVDFEATVTYFRGYEDSLFVQDEGEAIYVMPSGEIALAPGDRVRIEGVTQPSFRPVIRSSKIELLRHGAMPSPIPTHFGPLIGGNLDCMYVSIRGIVQLAAPTLNSGHRVSQIELVIDGGDVGVTVDAVDPGRLKELVDAEVEVSGIVSGRWDGKMQLIGVMVHVPSFDGVKVLQKAARSPESLPFTPMDQVLNTYNVQDRSGRVRITGTITYFRPALMAVLQDGDRSIRVLTPEIEPLRVGDRAEATGFPEVNDGFLALKLGDIHSLGEPATVKPVQVSIDDLAYGRHAFDLVSIDGNVVSEVRERAQDIYVISSEGHVFSAALRHPFVYDSDESQPPPMLVVPVGSKVRITGVAILNTANPFNGTMSFGVLLRSASDIGILARPNPLNVGNLLLVVGLLVLVVIGFATRGWALERKVRRHATELARRIEIEANLERRRSRILEDINGSRPLAEIVERITELVSFKLGGFPCWCQISDGALLGNCPPHYDEPRVVRREIPSRSGGVLGTLYAWLALPDSCTVEQTGALNMGAELVELAVETRRLYSDLRRRSEFDQLTDVHNRFSLESRLDALIVEARETAGVFGIIYIDLDNFKQVNDLYGHRAGDIYLQEVALRMKRQLRAGDLLARLGGDEFAAVARTVRSRADVEEVALRLERCFDEAFQLEGIELRGSASMGIALYPEDGKTRDSLLCAADAAMYVAKHSKRGLHEEAAAQASSELNSERGAP
jgi:diguanylate cyclase (GGDEF)-like protein